MPIHSGIHPSDCQCVNHRAERATVYGYTPTRGYVCAICQIGLRNSPAPYTVFEDDVHSDDRQANHYRGTSRMGFACSEQCAIELRSILVLGLTQRRRAAAEIDEVLGAVSPPPAQPPPAAVADPTQGELIPDDSKCANCSVPIRGIKYRLYRTPNIAFCSPACRTDWVSRHTQTSDTTCPICDRPLPGRAVIYCERVRVFACNVECANILIRDMCLCEVCNKLLHRRNMYATTPSIGMSTHNRPMSMVCDVCERKHSMRIGCSNCGGDYRVSRMYHVHTRGGWAIWCAECREGAFVCVSCSRTCPRNMYEDAGLCSPCYTSTRGNNAAGVLSSYSTRPPLDAIGDGPPWFGIEVEAVPRVNLSNAVKWISTFNKEFKKRIIVKADGSVGGGGEIVTCPMSLAEHHRYWRAVFDAGIKKYWKAWTYSACGLHVHISRAPLDGVPEAKLVAALNNAVNGERLDELAGRRPNDYCHRNSALKFSAPPLDHYAVVSGSQRYPTIEIRAFKASINLKRILCCLEFCACMADWTRRSGVGLIKSMNFAQVEAFAVTFRTKYPVYAGFALWGAGFFTNTKVPLTAAVEVDPAEAAKYFQANSEGSVDTTDSEG